MTPTQWKLLGPEGQPNETVCVNCGGSCACVYPWQMFQKLPKGHPSAVCEQSEALKQSSKHVSNRKNQPKSWSHMHWPFYPIPSTPSMEKLGENPTCHTERKRTRYKNQCKIESKQCIMSSQPGVGKARTLSLDSAGLARAIPGIHFNPWSQPHPSSLAKGKTHLRLAMVGWIYFFPFLCNPETANHPRKLNFKTCWITKFENQTCGSTTFQLAKLWTHKNMLMILFKICGFTIFRIKILWVHKFLKLHLWIHKKLNDCLFFKKNKENRGNSRNFFFEVW